MLHSDRLIFFMKEKPVLFFLFIFLILSLGVIGLEITRIDVRFALMLEDMARYKTGVFPTINGVEYPDYFSGYFLFSYLTTLGGKWVNLWTLALPSILFGTYTIFMTWKIGELFSARIGFYATLFSFLALEYLNVFLGFGIDAPVAAAGVTMLYLLEKNSLKNIWLICWFAFLLFFSYFTRGALGLILLGGATGGYLLAKRDWKRIFLFAPFGIMVLCACIALVYFAIQRQGGEALWKTFLDWHVKSRMGGHDYFYYFTDGLLSYAPGTILFLLTVLLVHKRLFSSAAAGLMGFIILPMILLSIPGCKHLRYMTISVPAIWIVTAWGLFQLKENRWKTYLNNLFVFLNKAIFWILLAAWGGIMISACFIPLENSFPWGHWIFGFVLSGTLLFLISPTEKGIRICSVLALYTIFAIFPLMVALDTSTVFVNKVMQVCNGKFYFFRIPIDHDELKFVLHVPQNRRNDIVYLRSKVPKKMQSIDRMYPFLLESDIFSEIKAGDVVILRKNAFPELEKIAKKHNSTLELLVQGDLGHRIFIAVRFLKSR